MGPRDQISSAFLKYFQVRNTTAQKQTKPNHGPTLSVASMITNGEKQVPMRAKKVLLLITMR